MKAINRLIAICVFSLPVVAQAQGYQPITPRNGNAPPARLNNVPPMRAPAPDLLEPGSRRKHAIVGALAGAAVGVAFGLYEGNRLAPLGEDSRSSKDRRSFKIGFPIAMGLLGGGVGAAIGASMAVTSSSEDSPKR